jgi:hypothetical protein
MAWEDILNVVLGLYAFMMEIMLANQMRLRLYGGSMKLLKIGHNKRKSVKRN